MRAFGAHAGHSAVVLGGRCAILHRASPLEPDTWVAACAARPLTAGALRGSTDFPKRNVEEVQEGGICWRPAVGHPTHALAAGWEDKR